MQLWQHSRFGETFEPRIGEKPMIAEAFGRNLLRACGHEERANFECAGVASERMDRGAWIDPVFPSPE
ncbi:MAG: hypothetical protein WBX25_27465 [Rhodomicrobium sp.]